MILIAESGSTKTDWVLIENNKNTLNISTSGFNPNYFPVEILDQGVAEIAASTSANQVSEIYFYGSGCTRSESKKMVDEVLKKHFGQAKTQVNNDLYGAARALFGDGSGIVSILGTGSSCCLFSDGAIKYQVPSLGYLLGDEGSGFHLGKLLVNAYFKGRLPDHLKQKLEAEANLNLSGFIGKIYSEPKPNSTLASFVTFIDANKHEPFIKNLVKMAFRDFFAGNISCIPRYRDFKLGFAGSVAFLFQDFLIETALESGLEISKIVKNPIGELAKYHSGKI